MRKAVIAGLFGAILVLAMAFVSPVTARESKVNKLLQKENFVTQIIQKVKEKLSDVEALGNGIPDLSILEVLPILALVLITYCNPGWYIYGLFLVLTGEMTFQEYINFIFKETPEFLLEILKNEMDDDNRLPFI